MLKTTSASAVSVKKQIADLDLTYNFAQITHLFSLSS